MRALFVLAVLAISGALLGLAGHQAPQPPAHRTMTTRLPTSRGSRNAARGELLDLS